MVFAMAEAVVAACSRGGGCCRPAQDGYWCWTGTGALGVAAEAVFVNLTVFVHSWCGLLEFNMVARLFTSPHCVPVFVCACLFPSRWQLCFVYCFWKSQCQTDVPDSSRPDTGGKPGSDYGEKPAPEPVKYGNTEASLTKHYAKN